VYDLIVIGDDLASHVAAAYASQNGLKTLLIAESGLGGLQLIGDFIFNLDATPLTGLGPDQLGLSILSELGIEVPEASIDPAFQVILPDHRIDFFNDPAALTSELAREFPDWDAEIREFYGMVHDVSAVFQDWIKDHPRLQPLNIKYYFSYMKMFPYIFQYKFGAAKFDKILSQDASLEKVWEAQQALLSFNTDDLFSFASAFQYSAPLRGVSFFPQGKQFLFNALVQILESNKGLYLNHYSVASIIRNKTIELEVKAPDGSISKASGHHLIISTKSDKWSLIDSKHKHFNFSDGFRPVKIVYYPFTIFLGVAEKGLPQQLARHIAVVPDTEKDLYDHNLIILETGPPDKDKPLSQAKNPLTATVYLPDIEANWTREALGQEAFSILDKLDVFFPFLKDNIDLCDIDKSIDISLNYRKVLSPKYKVRNAFFTSFAAKSHKTRFKNVFLTGASLLTDAGFDAEIISGKNAALQVLQKGD
jgi:phytoene dehydrogenase-like protein